MVRVRVGVGVPTAVVRPAPELPASALQPHPAHVCSAARVCTRRCRRCLWLALLVAGRRLGAFA